MRERLASSRAGNLDRTVRERWFVDFGCPGTGLRFGVGVQETTLRVKVRWVTPLGEETGSTW
jgi:hypothetical protein